MSTTVAQVNSAPKVIVKNENGWIDLRLAILENHMIEDDGRHVGNALTIGGEWEGEDILMNIGIPAEWDEANLNPPPPIKSWSTPISFVRAGSASDRFVRALARLYDSPDNELTAKNEVEFDALSLFEDPRPVGSKPVSLKLFLLKGDQLTKGEFYLNIDFGSRSVEIKEKDPEYRPFIIEAISIKK